MRRRGSVIGLRARSTEVCRTGRAALRELGNRPSIKPGRCAVGADGGQKKKEPRPAPARPGLTRPLACHDTMLELDRVGHSGSIENNRNKPDFQ